jgi:hypothetical protein
MQRLPLSKEPRHRFGAAVILLAAATHASPPETIVLTAADVNGLRGQGSNTVLNPALTGGYSLGRISYSGVLNSVSPSTWRSDARIELTAPTGDVVTIRPFLTGGSYSSLPFSGQAFLGRAVDPAGVWTVRLYETFDDGGPAVVDARVTATITLTDQPPNPPVATELGTLTAAGFESTVSSLPRAGIAWFTFVVPSFVCQGGPLFVDLDTFGSATQVTSQGQFPDDTVLALYDDRGRLVGGDDDDCGGLSAQLSFGAGVAARPPVAGGEPFTGADGSLPPGRYYAAVAAIGVRFEPEFWGSVNESVQITSPVVLRVRSNMGQVTPCDADFNCDGFLDFFDYDEYVQCYETGVSSSGRTADYNDDGFLDFFDYDEFVAAFEMGC